MKILLVDDDQDFLKMAKKILEEKWDFEIVTANLVEVAMDKLEKGYFDAIVSDYRMPKTNGIEFLEKVKEKDKDVPFILITGRGNEDVAMEALNRGADQYIRKFDDDDEALLSTLAERLSGVVKDQYSNEKCNFLQSYYDYNIKDRINLAYHRLNSLNEDVSEKNKDDFEDSLDILEEAAEMIEEKMEFKEPDNEEKVQDKFLDSLERSLGFSYYFESNLESNLWDIYKDKGEEKQKFIELAELSSESKELLEDLKEQLGGVDVEEASEKAKIRMSSYGIKSSKETFEKLWKQELVKFELYEELKSSTELGLLRSLWEGEDPDNFYEILEDLRKYCNDKIKIFEDMNEDLFSEEISEPKSALYPEVHYSSN